MKSPWPGLGLGLLMIAAIVAAQMSTRHESDFLETRINCCIADLDNTEFQEKAIDELIAIGPAAVEPVENALAVEPSDGLKKALARLAVHGAGGAIVKGLKIRLTSDKQAIRPGESLVLTTTVYNTRAVEMRVFAGWEYSGNAFATGSDLRAAFDRHRTNGQEEGSTTIGGASVCGKNLMLDSILITLPPKSATTYATTLGFFTRDITSSGGLPRETPFRSIFALLQTDSIYVVGKHRPYYLAVSRSGPHRLRIVHEVGEKWTRDYLFGDWRGCVISNDVEVQVQPEIQP